MLKHVVHVVTTALKRINNTTLTSIIWKQYRGLKFREM